MGGDTFQIIPLMMGIGGGYPMPMPHSPTPGNHGIEGLIFWRVFEGIGGVFKGPLGIPICLIS